MKKWLCAGLCLLLLGLTACGMSVFRGNRVLLDDEYSLEYALLNRADSATLSLKSGDVILVEVVSEEGQVSLSIAPTSGDAIYRGTEMPTSSFTVTVPEDGDYVFTVTGKSAKGGVRFAITSGS